MSYFARNEEYFDLFKQNFHDIIIKMIIPSMLTTESDFEIFLEEPKVFME